MGVPSGSVLRPTEHSPWFFLLFLKSHMQSTLRLFFIFTKLEQESFIIRRTLSHLMDMIRDEGLTDVYLMKKKREI